DAVRLANKIRTAVAEAPVSVGTGEVVVRISGGVACYPDHGASGVDVLRAADRALTAGKGAGRDRVAAAG
ncbi:MAG: diguanylate cyclase, partial [Gemmatimonadales bacterium]|nr:diguanylate cyclase [Gemmatimonadales bacterium]